jgi:hypothetical protein
MEFQEGQHLCPTLSEVVKVEARACALSQWLLMLYTCSSLVSATPSLSLKYLLQLLRDLEKTVKRSLVAPADVREIVGKTCCYV